MWRGFLAVADAAADARAPGAFEIGIIRYGHDVELARQLLQAENAPAKTALHSPEALTTLNLSAQVARLRAFFGFVLVHESRRTVSGKENTIPDLDFCQHDNSNRGTQTENPFFLRSLI